MAKGTKQVRYITASKLSVNVCCMFMFDLHNQKALIQIQYYLREAIQTLLLLALFFFFLCRDGWAAGDWGGGGGVFLNWNKGQAGERRWFGNDS